MTFYADLSSETPYSVACDGGSVRAVGWLDPAVPHTSGPVATTAFERLCALLADPWQPPAMTMGGQRCLFCRFTGGGSSRFGDLVVPSISCGALFVPGSGVLYVSPLSVAHYIDAHSYQPPLEFLDAVLACPPMRSMPYLKALLATAPAGLVRPAASFGTAEA